MESQFYEVIITQAIDCHVEYVLNDIVNDNDGSLGSLTGLWSIYNCRELGRHELLPDGAANTLGWSGTAQHLAAQCLVPCRCTRLWEVVTDPNSALGCPVCCSACAALLAKGCAKAGGMGLCSACNLLARKQHRTGHWFCCLCSELFLSGFMCLIHL